MNTPKVPILGKMLEQADHIAGSRSSILVPLQWMLIIFAVLFVSLVLEGAPDWALVGCGVSLALLLLLALGAFLYFMVKSPDHLRSEDYSLSKIAIERGLFGDSVTGLREIGLTVTPTKAIGEGAPQLGDGDDDGEDDDAVSEGDSSEAQQ